MDTHQYTVHMDQRGRLVLPAGIRHQLGIEPGSTLIMAMHEDGMLRLIGPGEAARKGRGLLHELAPNATMDRHLAEELIAERRIEAEHE
ncbi:AbrB family transcriptional regulator [Acidithiobacillus ferrivorans]|uniref:AbrB/MazE/SpoVT family DNA-binding domain-containing protein n=1 Tax=Acidithiobacillus ferrivorans TaxID=160808 RepID=UPI000892F134|nr:AbrB/MazE/SpoVT family DNA-binding domain-containing protein [Acidithiobacillus ferrivorans]MBU2768472.1 AbrB/MazE/SpoVT family DNA-binding domain-containing protein [Acidithiobacillus ferrivorans]OFA16992.1 AbrB family transcriptional regulator [Acidithiobacillus ferrivorans]